MHNGLPNFLVQAMLILAAGLFLSALLPIRRIHEMMPPCVSRTVWAGLGLLVGFSVAGVMAFLWVNQTEVGHHREDWLVAAVFLAAAVMVAVICNLAHSTVKDVSRMASLKLAASVDPVTELYNRRHIGVLLEEQCVRSNAEKSAFSLLLLDLDNFKQVNDAYGHQAGDMVLRAVARSIKASVPAPGMAGRFGGEEFLVILPRMGSLDARAVAERIRGLVERLTVMYEGTQILSPTVSVGIATAYGWHEKAEELIGLADEALYAAKGLGRNQTCHAFEPTGARSVSKFAVVSSLQDSRAS
jgi:diguanylate cyclase (GGDEF)-like protein